MITYGEIPDSERDKIYQDFAAINARQNLVQDNIAHRLSTHIKLLNRAKEVGCTQSHLRTQGKKNERFYEGFGFVEMGRLVEFGGQPGFDSVFYQMPIK
ncbi:MAG: hypothetical protein FWC71_08095 [Defluviitaleaceae bacterium]|nr:hypothetical protein [Defluviitaleaceae bacterium]